MMFTQAELEILARAMSCFIRHGFYGDLTKEEIGELADKVVSMQEPEEEEEEEGCDGSCNGCPEHDSPALDSNGPWGAP